MTDVPPSSRSAYTAQQFLDNYAPGMEDHWWSRARANIVQRALRGFRDATILDVGCGPGIVVQHLRRDGYDCFGCELGDPVVLPTARDWVRTGLDATALDPAFRSGVGVILLLDVLEHLPDPRAFLCNLLAAFPNLQAFVITVPARRELWSAWDQRFGHYRRYDRRTLATLCREADLHAPVLRYVFHGVYPVLLAAARITGRSTRSKTQRPRSLLNTVFAQLFAYEARLPIGRLVGSSIIAVAVPKQTSGGLRTHEMPSRLFTPASQDGAYELRRRSPAAQVGLCEVGLDR